MDSPRADVVLNKRQSQAIAFCIIGAIEEYCQINAEKFQDFLEAEAAKEAVKKDKRSRAS